jgi:surface protein
MYSMFASSGRIAVIDVSNFDTSNVTNMIAMFAGSSTVEELDVSNFNTSKIAKLDSMFAGCSNLKSLDLSHFDDSNIVSIGGTFSGCTSLEYLNFSNFDFSKLTYGISAYFSFGRNLKKLDLTNCKFPTSMYNIFSGCYCEEIIFDNVDTSLTTDMGSLFTGSQHIKKLDLSSFDTSNVTNMRYMFQSCRSLTEIDLSSFNTENVSRMENMFTGCSSLTSLDLSSFDITGVQQDWAIRGIVSDCYNLKELNISGWDFSNINGYSSSVMGQLVGLYTPLEHIILSNVVFPSYTRDFFSGMSSLTELDLDGVDTSNATNMSSMFLGCTGLTTLDLSSFDMSNVTNTDNMFKNCTSLTTGYAKTETDAAILNATTNKPSELTFTVKV